ncbi:uncharacterized protein LOC143021201 isoform X2 [Oratosquilla oratoria]|uniref:uncharacterized protein LOC143021201 isoform X2 n=1 Tax=Oratosquilla oratoria TaxID=337810 RepID=UPI003F764B14
MSDKKPIVGPYRATKLWNDAVRSFYNGMPLSRHWRGLRQYDNCFTAADAIDWLHQHLRNDPNFGTSVSREQTIKLLRKFVKSGLIEEVKNNKSNVENFKDNRDLYRFSNRSPLKALRTPKTPGRTALASVNKNIPDYGSSPVLRRHVQGSSKTGDTSSSKPALGKLDAISFVRRSTRRYKGDNAINTDKENKGKSKDKPEVNNIPECHLVQRPLTQEEQEEVWKHVLIGKLDCLVHKMLSCDPLPLFDPSLARGAWIQHNMTKLTSRGVVQVAPGHIDDLPKWILTAMKCLAHWPNTSDSSCNIPNYPGVEVDVFKIVRDFFTNMAVPLIPYELYEAVVRVYIGAEFLDITYRSPDRSGSSVSSPSSSFENYNPEALVTSDSVEDLMLNMSISGQQKTSTPFLGEENRGSSLRQREECSDRNFRCQGSLHSAENANNTCAPYTPSNHGTSYIGTNLQSLKLNRLKNYTDFKETNLYPTLLEGSHEESALNVDDTRLVFGQKGVDLSKMSDMNRVTGVTKSNNSAQYMRHNRQNSSGNVLCHLLKANKENEQRFGQGNRVFAHDNIQPYTQSKNVIVNQTDAFCVPSTNANYNGDREGYDNHSRQESSASSSVEAHWKYSEGGGVKRKRIYDDNTFLSSSELLGLDLPPNSCFETAFTSDSPRTRIIPQKSVDTIHIKNMSRCKSEVLSRKRPKSIAVTSASASDVKDQFMHPWGQGHSESKNISTVSDLFKSSIMSGNISGEYVTPPESIQSPMNRSRSAGNLRELVQDTDTRERCGFYRKCSPDSVSLHSVCDIKPELDFRQEVPSRGAVGYVKARDSIRRKRLREDSLTRKRLHANDDSEGYDDRGSYPEVNHLRTKSGGYMNLALTSSCEEVLESPIDDLYDDNVSINHNLNHIRTKSGGFINLALAPSNITLEDGNGADMCAAPLTSRSDSCVLDKPKGSLQQYRIRSKTPDGCLSHSLSSGSCSVYHSALSLTGRSCTPTSHHSSRSATRAPALPPRSPVPSAWPQQCESGGTIHDYENVFDTAQRPLSVSATNLSDQWADRTPFGQTPPYAKNGVWRHYHSSPSKRVIGRKKGLEYYYGSKACLPGLLTREGKDVAISALQLLLLLLPPVRRRKLHLLLLMMNKASNNDKLSLDPQHTTRALMLNTMARSILLCDQEADYDEVLAVRIVTFLMDYHEQVMKPPQELSVLVHRKISQMHKDQVSQNQYEKQRLTGSQLFLTELLDQILQNPKLTDKERKKKLKEFKTLYPEIYRVRFPKKDEKPTEGYSKMRSLMKLASLTSLGKGKSMRL